MRVDNSIPANNLLANNLDKLDEGIVEAWKALANTPVRYENNSLAIVGRWIDEGIEVTFETYENGAKVLSSKGDELAHLVNGKLLPEKYFNPHCRLRPKICRNIC